MLYLSQLMDRFVLFEQIFAIFYFRKKGTCVTSCVIIKLYLFLYYQT